MPLWRVYCPTGIYTAAEKQALAKAITEIYTTISPAKLPQFYVNVTFVEYTPENMYVGGQPQDAFIRFAGEHIARHMAPEETARMHKFMSWFTRAVSPWTTEKGFKWEAHIGQTPRELWRVDGLIPPPAESEAEVLWKTTNRPVPYENEGTNPSLGGAKLGSTAINGVMAARA